MSSALASLSSLSPTIWIGISVASLCMSICGVLAVPWMVARMPADWFSRPPQTLRGRLRAAPVATVTRNGLGLGLVLLGIALLFLPGQGVLTILLGTILTDLPLRDRGLRHVAQRPALARRLQHWRARAGVPPFAGLP